MKYFLTPIIVLVAIPVNEALLDETLLWNTVALLYVDLGLLLSIYIVGIIYWMKKASSAEKIKMRCLFFAYVGLGIILRGTFMGITGNYFITGTFFHGHGAAMRVLINTLGAEYGAWAPASLLLFIGAAAIFMSARRLVNA